MTEAEYERFIAHQRSLADAYVGVRLDDLCEQLGWQRGTWRRLRIRDLTVQIRASTEKFTKALEAMREAAARLGQ